MKSLNENWIVEGWIDLEYKKYILLAYLQFVCKNFNDQKLYPFITDLIFHYQHLIDFKVQKHQTSDGLKKRIKKIDVEKFKIIYEKAIQDNAYLEEIDAILEFAIPKIKETLSEGKEIYDFVEDQLNIEPIGLLPLNREAGYLMLSNGRKQKLSIYEYQMSIFENSKEQFRSLKTSFITKIEKSKMEAYEAVKLRLIKRNKSFPNPATFLIQSSMPFPMKETFLPIAKRSIVRYLARI